mmetsp:Transcript_41591/g.98628  ORF Transcript_41591/g.98628 Transcript_41591/m.98628 type:complete len:831 (+) Transcript_41591:3432-5924(+)
MVHHAHRELVGILAAERDVAELRAAHVVQLHLGGGHAHLRAREARAVQPRDRDVGHAVHGGAREGDVGLERDRDLVGGARPRGRLPDRHHRELSDAHHQDVLGLRRHLFGDPAHRGRIEVHGDVAPRVRLRGVDERELEEHLLHGVLESVELQMHLARCLREVRVRHHIPDHRDGAVVGARVAEALELEARPRGDRHVELQLHCDLVLVAGQVRALVHGRHDPGRAAELERLRLRVGRERVGRVEERLVEARLGVDRREALGVGVHRHCPVRVVAAPRVFHAELHCIICACDGSVQDGDDERAAVPRAGGRELARRIGGHGNRLRGVDDGGGKAADRDERGRAQLDVGRDVDDDRVVRPGEGHLLVHTREDERRRLHLERVQVPGDGAVNGVRGHPVARLHGDPHRGVVRAPIEEARSGDLHHHRFRDALVVQEREVELEDVPGEGVGDDVQHEHARAPREERRAADVRGRGTVHRERHARRGGGHVLARGEPADRDLAGADEPHVRGELELEGVVHVGVGRGLLDLGHDEVGLVDQERLGVALHRLAVGDGRGVPGVVVGAVVVVRQPVAVAHRRGEHPDRVAVHRLAGQSGADSGSTVHAGSLDAARANAHGRGHLRAVGVLDREGEHHDRAGVDLSPDTERELLGVEVPPRPRGIGAATHGELRRVGRVDGHLAGVAHGAREVRDRDERVHGQRDVGHERHGDGVLHAGVGSALRDVLLEEHGAEDLERRPVARRELAEERARAAGRGDKKKVLGHRDGRNGDALAFDHDAWGVLRHHGVADLEGDLVRDVAERGAGRDERQAAHVDGARLVRRHNPGADAVRAVER